MASPEANLEAEHKSRLPPAQISNLFIFIFKYHTMKIKIPIVVDGAKAHIWRQEILDLINYIRPTRPMSYAHPRSKPARGIVASFPSYATSSPFRA